MPNFQKLNAFTSAVNGFYHPHAIFELSSVTISINLGKKKKKNLLSFLGHRLFSDKIRKIVYLIYHKSWNTKIFLLHVHVKV